MDAVNKVRCPYCVDKDGFKGIREIYLVCSSSGHAVIPDQPEYQCPCGKCNGMTRMIEIPARW